MPAYNPRAARRARRKVRVLRRRIRAYKRQERQAKQFDPTAPLTGQRFRQERKAAERLEFGPRAQELRQATARQEQTTADRATYYDDWRQALREATARVNEANRQNVIATEQRVDSAYAQDSAAVKARDAAQSEQAAKLGRGPVQSTEGARAVEAQRSQGNQKAALLRGQASADTKYMELRGVNAAQAKIEDQERMRSKREQLRKEERDLARARGAFRTDFRRRARRDEREWAAIQKEFGLKRREQDLDHKNTAAQRKLERQKLRTQRIVAGLYSSANRAQARAQIRVARLQLRKGKISQKQYRHIVNEYRGLPERPTEFTFNHNGGRGGKGNRGPGSGAGGSLAPWEKDRVEKMVRTWKQHNVPLSDRRDAFKRMRDANPNMQDYLIRIAWRRYRKKYGVNLPDDLPSYPTPGDGR